MKNKKKIDKTVDLEEERRELLASMNKRITPALKEAIDIAYKLSEKKQPELKITTSDNTSAHA